ncbi:MAG: phospholipase D family protein [Tomitella sp.]|nr:phospholipase D family protein [Tomitella sp.]
MLTPDARTVLLDDLQAPPGYEVDAAVATTFTLDLTAAMLPPFAISGIGTGAIGRDPISLLQALRHASDKVDVFCQAGAIGVPRSADLVAFLEPMVHQIVPPVGALFHPKIWLLRFTSPSSQTKYRLLVLSRNLTHDNTWDVAVRLDSESVADRPRADNDALTALLRWLPDHAIHISRERRERVLTLADEVSRVHWERPEHVEEVRLHTGGVPGQPSIDLGAGRHLVISPFVTADGLARATKGHKDRPALVSRQETLDDLDPEVLDGVTAYTMAADTAVPMEEGEGVEAPSQSDDAPQPSGTLSGLHAKVYVVEPTDTWTKARVLLGSSNATEPGLTKNVEFLVEVLGRREHLGVEQVLPSDGSSTKGIRPLVEPYVRQAPIDRTEEKTRRRLQHLLRSIAAIHHVVSISEETSTTGPTYSASVASDHPYPAREVVTVTINLLTRSGSTSEVVGRPDLTVSGLAAADITPCVAVTATEGSLTESTVVLGRLEGAPAGRLDAVIANQVNDKDKFRRLVLLLLSLGNPAELAALLADNTSGDESSAFFGNGSSGILELVLRGLGARSAAIDDLDRLVAAVNADVLPDGFEAFWEQVRQARLLLQEESA